MDDRDVWLIIFVIVIAILVLLLVLWTVSNTNDSSHNKRINQNTMRSESNRDRVNATEGRLDTAETKIDDLESGGDSGGGGSLTVTEVQSGTLDGNWTTGASSPIQTTYRLYEVTGDGYRRQYMEIDGFVSNASTVSGTLFYGIENFTPALPEEFWRVPASVSPGRGAVITPSTGIEVYNGNLVWNISVSLQLAFLAAVNGASVGTVLTMTGTLTANAPNSWILE